MLQILLTSTGSLFVQDAVTTFTALNHIARLQGVFLPTVYIQLRVSH